MLNSASIVIFLACLCFSGKDHSRQRSLLGRGYPIAPFLLARTLAARSQTLSR